MSRLITDPKALIASFPYSVARDEDKEKVAEAVSEELVKTIAASDNARIFPAVDTLPEEVLDTLAYDLKCDWYEPDAPVWNKRQAIRECMLVHRYKGTKYAVETALHSMFNVAEVQEWFQYSGEPFHFKVKVYGSTSANLKKLYVKIQYAKNIRSVMDDVVFVLVPEKAIESFFGAALTSWKKSFGVNFAHSSSDVFNRRTETEFSAAITSSQKSIHAVLEYSGADAPSKKINVNTALNVSMFKKNIKTGGLTS